jgi:hypothetical protein
MKIYADTAGRRGRQIAWDVLGLLFLTLWAWFGVQVHDAIDQLEVVGVKMEGVGGSLNEDLTSIADTLGSVPLIGDGIRAPFESAANAATSIQEAGTSQREAVQTIALYTAIGLVLGPMLMVLTIWLAPRAWWIVRANRAARVAGTSAGIDLLALRALTQRDLSELLELEPDPADAWRRGDRVAIARLAALECEAIGLAPPPELSSMEA